MGDALVSRSRSLAASAFLRSDCEVMLSIDSDIFFRGVDAIDLCEQALAGHDIIGALYMTRAIKTQPAMMLPDKPVTFAPGQTPFETPFVATGFCAVTRAPLEALAKTLPHCHQSWKTANQDTSFYPFFMPFTMEWPEDGHIYLSEDWAFCERARQAGFKTWVHPGLRVGHVGSYMYTLEDIVRPEKALPQPLRMIRSPQGELKTEFTKQIAPELQTLPRDIADYLNFQTPEKLKEFLKDGTARLAQLWETKAESEAEWYRRGDVGAAFLADLAAWHLREPMLSILTESLVPFAGKGLRVLDHGSGIGTSALILANGNAVDCVEPNRYLRKFTEWRAKRMDRKVNFPAQRRNDYDLVVSCHVLEHVADPKALAIEVVRALKPGGLLFADADFTNNGDHPMHHVSEEDPQGAHFWQDQGLERLSTFWWKKPG